MQYTVQCWLVDVGVSGSGVGDDVMLDGGSSGSPLAVGRQGWTQQWPASESWHAER